MSSGYCSEEEKRHVILDNHLCLVVGKCESNVDASVVVLSGYINDDYVGEVKRMKANEKVKGETLVDDYQTPLQQ